MPAPFSDTRVFVVPADKLYDQSAITITQASDGPKFIRVGSTVRDEACDKAAVQFGVSAQEVMGARLRA